MQQVNGASLPAVQESRALMVPETTAGVAMAQRAKSEIEAAFIVAKRFPRDYDDVRARVLKTCTRPTFADDKSVLFSRPVGKGKPITGPGIRLAEELARSLGNIQARTEIIDEDGQRVVLRAVAVDLETNMRQEQEVVIAKTIERQGVRKGQTILGQRENTKGETVYLVEASDDEVYVKTNSMASRALRNVLLRLVPADLVSEALDTIEKTRRNQAAADPDAYRKKVMDGFAMINVTPSQIAAYLGYPVARCSPAELEELRKVWQSVHTGETTWQDITAAKDAAPEEGEIGLDDLEAGDESEHQDIRDHGGAPEGAPGTAEPEPKGGALEDDTAAKGTPTFSPAPEPPPADTPPEAPESPRNDETPEGPEARTEGSALPGDPEAAEREAILAKLRVLRKSKPESFATALFDKNVTERGLKTTDVAVLHDILDQIGE